MGIEVLASRPKFHFYSPRSAGRNACPTIEFHSGTQAVGLCSSPRDHGSRSYIARRPSLVLKAPEGWRTPRRPTNIGTASHQQHSRNFKQACDSMALEILHRFFVLLCRGARLKRAEVSPFSCLRIFLSRIQAITARFKFSNHELLSGEHRLCRRAFPPCTSSDLLWPGCWSLLQCERRNTSYATGIAR